MGDVSEKQKLLDSINKKIEWLELMKEIIDPLYKEIEKQYKQLEESRINIYDHMSRSNSVKPGKQQHCEHRNKALKEAENYIKAERKWIAFKEISKQCQNIEEGISFPIERGSTDPSCPERVAMASLIYASEFFEPMKKARTMFKGWYKESSDHIALDKESVDPRYGSQIVVPEIKNYPADVKPGQTKEKEKPEKEKLEKEELEKKKKKLVDIIAGEKRQEP